MNGEQRVLFVLHSSVLSEYPYGVRSNEREPIRPGSSSLPFPLPPSNFLSHRASPPMEVPSQLFFSHLLSRTSITYLHLESLSFSSSSLPSSVSPAAISSGTGSVGLLFSTSAHHTTISVCQRTSPPLTVSSRSTPYSSFLISPWCLGQFDRFHRLHHWLESSRSLEKYHFSPHLTFAPKSSRQYTTCSTPSPIPLAYLLLLVPNIWPVAYHIICLDRRRCNKTYWFSNSLLLSIFVTPIAPFRPELYTTSCPITRGQQVHKFTSYKPCRSTSHKDGRRLYGKHLGNSLHHHQDRVSEICRQKHVGENTDRTQKLQALHLSTRIAMPLPPNLKV